MPTLQAFIAADDAIAAGPGFGALPLLYVHGGDDQLVPAGLAQPGRGAARGRGHQSSS